LGSEKVFELSSSTDAGTIPASVIGHKKMTLMHLGGYFHVMYHDAGFKECKVCQCQTGKTNIVTPPKKVQD